MIRLRFTSVHIRRPNSQHMHSEKSIDFIWNKINSGLVQGIREFPELLTVLCMQIKHIERIWNAKENEMEFRRLFLSLILACCVRLLRVSRISGCLIHVYYTG